VELLFISTNGIGGYVDDTQELNEKAILPVLPNHTCINRDVHENKNNSILSHTAKSEPFLQIYISDYTYSLKTKINDTDMPVISLSTQKPFEELSLGKVIHENDEVGFVGSRIARCSLCYVTGHYIREGITLHATGAEFHFIFVHDGENHWINLTGVLEIEFMDGQYVRDDDFNLVTKWRGDEKKIMPLTITLFWPDRPINWIHFTVSYSEDDQHLRTIERIFYGNWGQQ
jgi:hypothetical protein